MVTVIGEALIDLVQQAREPSGAARYVARPGGSPFNVAVGLARLGQQVTLAARLSSDAFGQQLRTHALSNGVDLWASVSAAEPSTLAVVGTDEHGNAQYSFYRHATADWQWTAAELARVDDTVDWVHTGSLASWIEPGATAIGGRLRSISRAGGIVSFDPNVRPALMPERHAAIGRIEALIALADVVKASDEDVAWLYPGADLDAVLSRWADLGPSLLVITQGAAGARALQNGQAPFSVPGRQVSVVDTVGAGDAFMAGVINAVRRGGVTPRRLSQEQAAAAVAEAIVVATLTCERAGADPPTLAQLHAAQA